MKITILLGLNDSGKTTWMQNQKPDVWIKGNKKLQLSNKENITVAYENPELGLHPNIHGETISKIITNAKNKKQDIIIETHSETMFLRVRRLIACNILQPSDVIVYWFEKYSDNDVKNYGIGIDRDGDLEDNLPKGIFEEDWRERRAMLKKIDINEQGQLIDYFPDGIFEEAYIELDNMMNLKAP